MAIVVDYSPVGAIGELARRSGEATQARIDQAYWRSVKAQKRQFKHQEEMAELTHQLELDREKWRTQFNIKAFELEKELDLQQAAQEQQMRFDELQERARIDRTRKYEDSIIEQKEIDAKLKKAREVYEKGLFSEDEYKRVIAKIVGGATLPTPETEVSPYGKPPWHRDPEYARTRAGKIAAGLEPRTTAPTPAKVPTELEGLNTRIAKIWPNFTKFPAQLQSYVHGLIRRGVPGGKELAEEAIGIYEEAGKLPEAPEEEKPISTTASKYAFGVVGRLLDELEETTKKLTKEKLLAAYKRYRVANNYAISSPEVQTYLDENWDEEIAYRQQTRPDTTYNWNPSDPDIQALRGSYDYEAAIAAGAKPDETGHWPSKFKREGSPEQFIDGLDTKRASMSEVIATYTRFAKDELGLGATPEQIAKRAKEMAKAKGWKMK